MTVTNCFCMRSSRFLPTDPQGNNTLQTSTPTHFVHGRQVCFSFVFKKEQVKSDNIAEHEGIG